LPPVLRREPVGLVIIEGGSALGKSRPAEGARQIQEKIKTGRPDVRGGALRKRSFRENLQKIDRGSSGRKILSLRERLDQDEEFSRSHGQFLWVGQ
jgi:hypothetical protein